MKTIELKVSGMSCGHCVSSIETGVGNMNGVDNVTVKLDEGRVTITFDSDQVNKGMLKLKIEDLGYDIQ
ncbi:copper ion binding protein [Shouchella miscanthi]|uniref:copper ion binding protein n=1 Tax=Shouchella miscanthi TaxID=2598861 RepID=UPI00119E02F7|nr:copper ion binding protein [Shouchella miscanthi]